MKRIKVFLLLSFLCFYNCAELLPALSNVNQGMGGKCTNYHVDPYVYSSSSDDWLFKKYITIDKKGNDIRYEEKNWYDKTATYYLNRMTFNTYYKTSPYSGGRYKFVVSCTRWNR